MRPGGYCVSFYFQIGELVKKKALMGEPGDEIPADIRTKLSELNKELVSDLSVTVLKKIVSEIEQEMKTNSNKLQVFISSK